MILLVFQPEFMFLCQLCSSPPALVCPQTPWEHGTRVFLFKKTGKQSGEDWQLSLCFCTREWTAQKTVTAALPIAWKKSINVWLYTSDFSCIFSSTFLHLYLQTQIRTGLGQPHSICCFGSQLFYQIHLFCSVISPTWADVAVPTFWLQSQLQLQISAALGST